MRSLLVRRRGCRVSRESGSLLSARRSMLGPLFTKDLEYESLANFALTEFSEIERGAEREIGKEEGEVLPGKAAGKGAEVQSGRPSAVSGVQPYRPFRVSNATD